MWYIVRLSSTAAVASYQDADAIAGKKLCALRATAEAHCGRCGGHANKSGVISI